jgi:hypothetical protein
VITGPEFSFMLSLARAAHGVHSVCRVSVGTIEARRRSDFGVSFKADGLSDASVTAPVGLHGSRSSWSHE